MPRKELNLFQITAGGLAQLGAGATEIVRGQLCNSDCPCAFLHNIPDGLVRHTVAPDAAHLGYLAENPATVILGRWEPFIQFHDHPVGDRNRTDVTVFAPQIDYCQMIFTLM